MFEATTSIKLKLITDIQPWPTRQHGTYRVRVAAVGPRGQQVLALIDPWGRAWAPDSEGSGDNVLWGRLPKGIRDKILSEAGRLYGTVKVKWDPEDQTKVRL